MSHTVESGASNVPTVDFGSLAAQASEMITAGNTSTSSTPPSVPTAPAEGQTSASLPAAFTSPTPTSPTLQVETAPQAQQPPPGTIPVDLGNGRVEHVTSEQLREWHANGLRQADYTRKTQELAEQRRQIQEAGQYIQQTLNNPSALLQLAQQHYSQQPNTPQAVDPNAPVTMAQLQQFAQLQQQSYANLQQQAQQYVENRLQVANYAENINQTLGEVFTQHPVLKLDPSTEEVLRWKVSQMNPQDLPSTQAAIKSVAAEMAGKYQNFYQSQQQSATVQRAQLAATGTVAPGGAAPQALQQPTYQKPDGGLDWNALAAAALQSVQG